MAQLTPQQNEFIDRSWSGKWDSVMHAQNQIIGWIFTVHGGGIAGLLTLAATKGAPISAKIGLGAFILGLVLIAGFGVCMFYLEARYFYRFRDEVKRVHAGEIGWDEFLKRLNSFPDKYLICEWLAWSSGVCGLIGLAAAIIAIL